MYRLSEANLDSEENLLYHFHAAIIYNKLENIKKLLKSNRKVLDPSILENACRYGNLEIVKELLKDSRIDPSSSDNSAIKAASLHGHLEIVKELLKDPRVETPDETTLVNTLSYGYVDVVKELLKDPRMKKFDQHDSEFLNYINIYGRGIKVPNELIISSPPKKEKILQALLDEFYGYMYESEIYHYMNKISEFFENNDYLPTQAQFDQLVEICFVMTKQEKYICEIFTNLSKNKNIHLLNFSEDTILELSKYNLDHLFKKDKDEEVEELRTSLRNKENEIERLKEKLNDIKLLFI